MSIDLSEQTTNKLGAIIGTSNPEAIAKLIERFADNAPFVQALLLEDATDQQVEDGLAMFKRGEEEIDETGGLDFEQSLRGVAKKYDLDLEQ